MSTKTLKMTTCKESIFNRITQQGKQEKKGRGNWWYGIFYTLALIHANIAAAQKMGIKNEMYPKVQQSDSKI